MLALKKEDCDFILAAYRFYNRVEWYGDLLDLNPEVLYAFTSQHMILNHILANNVLWNPELEDFFSATLENLKVAYQYLTLLCKCSPNYTDDMGVDLGLETDDIFYSFSAN